MEFAVLAFFCGLSAGAIGRIKGSSFLLWFFVGLCLPILGTLAALLYRFEGREPRRECPECGTALPLSDQICRRCGRDLEFPEELTGQPV